MPARGRPPEDSRLLSPTRASRARRRSLRFCLRLLLVGFGAVPDDYLGGLGDDGVVLGFDPGWHAQGGGDLFLDLAGDMVDVAVGADSEVLGDGDGLRGLAEVPRRGQDAVGALGEIQFEALNRGVRGARRSGCR